MKNNEYITKRLKKTIENDKMMNNESLSRLLESEIMHAVSAYLDIDPIGFEFKLKPDGAGLIINCSIKARNIKRLGSYII